MKKDLLYLAPEPTAAIARRGNFDKKVWVVLSGGEQPASEKIFLEKILLAVHLHVENDTSCWSLLPHQKISLVATARQLQARKVLTFGFMPADLGIALQIPWYQPLEWGGTTYLLCEALALLESDRQRKTRLWSALQAMFL